MQPIDLRGVSCTSYLVQAKLALDAIDAGTVVELLLDDGEQVKKIPANLRAEGHKLIGLKEVDDYYSLTLKKGDQ